MNQFLPLNALKRDELYSFLGGFLTASVWYVYLEKIGVITSQSFFSSPMFFILWLLGTAFQYLFSLVLTTIFSRILSKDLLAKDLDEELKARNIKEKTFFYSTAVEEYQIQNHILCIITIVLILNYFPVIKILATYLKLSMLITILALHLLFISTSLVFYRYSLKEIILLNLFIKFKSCEIMDYKTYITKRAEAFAEVKRNEYLQSPKSNPS